MNSSMLTFSGIWLPNPFNFLINLQLISQNFLCFFTAVFLSTNTHSQCFATNFLSLFSFTTNKQNYKDEDEEEECGQCFPHIRHSKTTRIRKVKAKVFATNNSATVLHYCHHTNTLNLFYPPVKANGRKLCHLMLRELMNESLTA